MLFLLGVKGLGLEGQAFEVLDVRTAGYLGPRFTDRKLRPENLYGLTMGR